MKVSSCSSYFHGEGVCGGGSFELPGKPRRVSAVISLHCATLI